MSQKKALYEAKKLHNLRMHNKLLKIAIILQCIHLPLAIPSISIFIAISIELQSSKLGDIIFITMIIYGYLFYYFRWYYWGIVIIEGIFLLVFLFKTEDVFNTIKKEKKKYILFLLLLICNLIIVVFCYDNFWYGVATA